MNTERKYPVTVIQFTRSPEGDGVKTRLSPVLNNEQRLSLHQAMTQRAFQQAFFSYADKVIVAVDGNRQNAFFDTLYANIIEDVDDFALKNKTYQVVGQQGDNLGQKMFFAAQHEKQSNVSDSAIILIGSDCPFISSEYLNTAIESLASFPVVIGPANDGGYVLLGMREITPSLFNHISWGSGQVLEETCKVLMDEKILYKELDVLNDIDRPEDLALLSRFSETNNYFKNFFESL